MRIIGGILGAMIAPILLILLVSMVYRPPSHDNWDWFTPAATLIAAAGAVIVGAIAGSLVGAALQRGDARQAASLGGATVVLLALFPAWLAWLLYGPRPPVRPATESRRAEWVAAMDSFYAKYGFSEEQGSTLAWTLRSAMLSGQFESVQWRNYSRGEDSVAANGPGYKIEDNGWRWEYIEGRPGSAIVFLDPRLKRDGPVFEIDGREIYRRATRTAPAFSTNSTLAAAFTIPDCIARFARTAREAGTWDGRPDTLPATVAAHWTGPDGCPRVRVYTRPEHFGRPWEFEVGGEMQYVRFELRPDSSDDATPFRFAFMMDGRGFMREANGAWHARDRGPALVSDPHPPQCLFDLSVPCSD